MQLSEPIYMLKRQARLLARETGIPLHQALDKVALDEGFQGWSHLASSYQQSPAHDILSQLEPGDFVLIGARPGQGKTLLGLELASKAARLGRKGHFFTLDYHERDVADQLAALGIGLKSIEQDMVVDTSDDICADYIIRRLDRGAEPALVVIDYLQLLDQKRSNPTLESQMQVLQNYVRDTGAICAVISQIDRAFDLLGKAMPDTSDIRLPNPCDLTVFRKVLFLHQGRMQFDCVA